jgi:hypothetical protein
LLPTLSSAAPPCEVCEKAAAVAGKECLHCHDAAPYIQAQRDGLDDL